MSTIALPTIQSLLLEMMCGGEVLFTGTGFVCVSSKGPMLITNLHNVTGVDPVSGAALALKGQFPDAVKINHNGASPGSWTEKSESLKGQPWIVHPVHQYAADFVALPLTNTDGVKLYPYDLFSKEPSVAIGVTEPVSVVGFPFGLTGGGCLALWANGFIASEPTVDFQNLPTFLIDCRTRPGQSGSAVVAYRQGGHVKMANGGTIMRQEPFSQLLGVYSGRVNEQSDLGIVWKTSALAELVASIK